MTQIVFKHRGSVDKYMGDGIMALYNAPFDDPEHALTRSAPAGVPGAGARGLREVVRRVSAPTFVIGVGINTGEMLCGTLGSRSASSTPRSATT
jgi:adenylate cyclase